MKTIALPGALLLTTCFSVGAVADEASTSATKKAAVNYSVGGRFRYVFLPTSFLNLFLDHSTAMSSMGVGAEIIRSKGNFDVAVGVEYENVEPAPGYFLKNGDDPGNADEAPDYVSFDGLALLGVDVSFLWHVPLSTWLQLRYGAGVGLGVLLGDIYTTDVVCAVGTNPGDLDDAGAAPCDAIGQAEREEDLPPVLPIVNLLAGMRFKLADKLTIDVEGGFRDVFFLGIGTKYTF